jgi:zinc transporter ZupT
LLSNGIINLSAFIGCLIGLGIGSIENQNYVYAFVAGNFIYISCVDMIPEVLKESNYKVAFM